MNKGLSYPLLFNAGMNFFSVLSLLILISCTDTAEKLTVATAANSQYAISAIAEQFKVDTGIELDLIISSSGKHTAQILAGAPYDVFISADLKYPEKLYKAGLTLSKPKIYAYGQLVLWSNVEDLSANFSVANFPSFKRIAIANPITAPYGVTARDVLVNLEIWDNLSENIVYGESVAQTNQYIISGAVNVGFTAASVVMAPENKNIGRWAMIPDSLHSPISQGVVTIKSSSQLMLAEKFYQYLFSEKSKAILRSYGYKIR